jgi:hypothetical protein
MISMWKSRLTEHEKIDQLSKKKLFVPQRCRRLREGLVSVHGEHGRRHGQADDDGQQEPEHRGDPGTDFMNLRFGRKLFGPFFYIQISDKFPSKNNRY